MSEKSMDQFLFEYNPRADRTPDMSTTDDQGTGTGSVDTFSGIKNDLGSYERMISILAGKEKFEYNLLDNKRMVRALVDQVKQMIKNKEKIRLQNKSVSDRVKELEAIQYKTPVELDELAELKSKNKAYQLQKTLMRFEKKLDELDDILNRMENGVEVTDKTIKKYDNIVADIEDSIFQETYVRKNLAYDKGEASGGMKKPTAMDNFAIKFRADNGAVYYGIVRPPSGMITWEGNEAREAFLQDVVINNMYAVGGRGRSRDERLKIRISKDDFKVLPKEILNDKLFSLRTENGMKKVEFNDTDTAKNTIRSFIMNDDADGAPRDVTNHSVSGIEGVLNQTKTVQPGLDKSGRPRDLTAVIDSIEFWRVIRGLL